MPPKKYQNDDPDSDEELLIHEKQVLEDKRKSLPQDDIKNDLPKKLGRNHIIDPEKITEAIKGGVISLNKTQTRKLLPVVAPARKKRVITPEEKERLLNQLKKAREIVAQRKALAMPTVKEELAEKKENYIKEKMVMIAPPKIKKREKKELPAPEPEPEPEQKQLPPPPRKKQEPNNYPSDDETEGDTTDTRSIKKVKRKLKMVRKPIEHQQQQQQIQQPKSYRDMSLIEKLYSKF